MVSWSQPSSSTTWPRSCSSAAAARSSDSCSETGRIVVAGTARLRQRVLVGYKRPMDAPPDLAADLRAALAREFRGAGDPLVDRLEQVATSLWRCRCRWREEDGAHAAWLALRPTAERALARREARALEIAHRAGVAAPTVWLSEPLLVVDWIDGESFAAAWRRRDPR